MALKDSGDKVHVIFGNGPVGSAAARYLLGKGFKVRMASRSGRRPPVLFDDLPAQAQERLEFAAADATNPEDTLRAARGASHIYHCANVLYQDWWKLLPPIQENLIAAALRENAVLAVSENLYMYARGVPVIDETTPETPPTRKGLLRKELHDRLVAAGTSQGLAWTSVRASDYYGPGAGLQSMFGTNLFLDPVFNGKRPRVVGALDQPHSVTFVEDYGRALAVAALDPRARGRSWIVPNDRARTTRETAQVFFDAAGRKKKLGVIPRPLIAALGIFNPLLRELVEMLYQKEEPYVVDGASFARTFGFTPTPLEEGVRRTLEWYGKAQRTRLNQVTEKAVA
jgi:nucleoside-diphosphate-sugar epimerase